MNRPSTRPAARTPGQPLLHAAVRLGIGARSLSVGVADRLHRRASEHAGASDRGDVPGWVLVTLMTAGLVAVVGAVARARLVEVFDRAMSTVLGP